MTDDPPFTRLVEAAQEVAGDFWLACKRWEGKCSDDDLCAGCSLRAALAALPSFTEEVQYGGNLGAKMKADQRGDDCPATDRRIVVTGEWQPVGGKRI